MLLKNTRRLTPARAHCSATKRVPSTLTELKLASNAASRPMRCTFAARCTTQSIDCNTSSQRRGSAESGKNSCLVPARSGGEETLLCAATRRQSLFRSRLQSGVPTKPCAPVTSALPITVNSGRPVRRRPLKQLQNLERQAHTEFHKACLHVVHRTGFAHLARNCEGAAPSTIAEPTRRHIYDGFVQIAVAD